MGRKSQNFSIGGPKFLTAVDWNNSHHRRSVAACLVQGVYIMEEDRRHGRQGPDVLAPPWWLSFNFRPVQILVDNHDLSRYGAVFEFTNYNQEARETEQPPQYVIAFRGTVLKLGTVKEDLKLDFHLWLNDHKKSSRFHTGLETATQVARCGNVWLAGHSLGSSLALAVGREMAMGHGIHLETYLFNPPFITLPIEWIKSEKLKLGLRIISSAITAGVVVAGAAAGAGAWKMDHFTALSTWVPYMFINLSDPICAEYAGYFKHRGDMEAIGAGEIEKVATENALGSILSSCEAMHLLPSAYLSINGAPSLKEAHRLRQWWRHDLELEYKHYLH